MIESGARTKLWVLSEESAGRFDGGEIALGDFPVGVANIPLVLRSTSARKSSDLRTLMAWKMGSAPSLVRG